MVILLTPFLKHFLMTMIDCTLKHVFHTILNSPSHDNLDSLCDFILSKLDDSNAEEMKDLVWSQFSQPFSSSPQLQRLFCRISVVLIEKYKMKPGESIKWIFAEPLATDTCESVLDLATALVKFDYSWKDSLFDYAWKALKSPYIILHQKALKILSSQESIQLYLDELFKDFTDSYAIQNGLSLLMELNNLEQLNIYVALLCSNLELIDKAVLPLLIDLLRTKHIASVESEDIPTKFIFVKKFFLTEKELIQEVEIFIDLRYRVNHFVLDMLEENIDLFLSNAKVKNYLLQQSLSKALPVSRIWSVLSLFPFSIDELSHTELNFDTYDLFLKVEPGKVRSVLLNPKILDNENSISIMTKVCSNPPQMSPDEWKQIIQRFLFLIEQDSLDDENFLSIVIDIHTKFGSFESKRQLFEILSAREISYSSAKQSLLNMLLCNLELLENEEGVLHFDSILFLLSEPDCEINEKLAELFYLAIQSDFHVASLERILQYFFDCCDSKFYALADVIRDKGVKTNLPERNSYKSNIIQYNFESCSHCSHNHELDCYY